MSTVPAATAHRQLGDPTLVHAPGSPLVHIAVGQTPRRLLCSTTVRELLLWTGRPMRTCTTCARAAVPTTARGRWWTPSPLELAAVHLARAWSLNAAVAEAIADIRTEAMHDGSALRPASDIPQYRAARGLTDNTHEATPLGAVLHAAAPRPVATVADDHAAALREQAELLRVEAMRTRTRDRIRDLREAKDAARKAPRR